MTEVTDDMRQAQTMINAMYQRVDPIVLRRIDKSAAMHDRLEELVASIIYGKGWEDGHPEDQDIAYDLAHDILDALSLAVQHGSNGLARFVSPWEHA